MPRSGPSDTSQIFVYDPGVAERAPLDLDAFERSFLGIARDSISSFDAPQLLCWMTAFLEAERIFPAPFGATIAHAIAISINALRDGRSSPFAYFRTGDPLADLAMTRQERYLLLSLRGIRRNDPSTARANALLVCEGGDTMGFLAALERLCLITGDVSECQYQP